MTTLSERVERLRKQREHCAICEGCDGGAKNDGGHHTRKVCQCMATMTLYPGVCDPREAYLDALALAWELRGLLNEATLLDDMLRLERVYADYWE